jgi:hypothetical protein
MEMLAFCVMTVLSDDMLLVLEAGLEMVSLAALEDAWSLAGLRLFAAATLGDVNCKDIVVLSLMFVYTREE